MDKAAGVRVWSGVRCGSSGSTVYDYDGTTYFTSTNSAWCAGQPDNGCVYE